MKFQATKPRQTPLRLEKAPEDFRISTEEFDEVAAELSKALDYYKVHAVEKQQVLGAFAAHKKEENAARLFR